MAIDTTQEQLITLHEAAALLPHRRAGKPTHMSSLWRWCVHGFKGVVLESVCVGSSRCTSREALDRFHHAVAANTGRQYQPSPQPTPKAASVRSRRDAKKRLTAAGLM